MDRDSAVAEIAQGLGMRRNLEAIIIQRLIQAQMQLEAGRTLPWFIINEDSPVEILEGVQQYDLSDYFIREVDDLGQHNYVSSSLGDIYHVTKVDYDDAIAKYGFGPDRGWPEVYALRSTSIAFFPIPDKDYHYRWHFYQKQASLAVNATDEQNAWLKHIPYLLIAKAGRMCARITRDVDAYKLFEEQEKEWTDWLTREMAAREQADEVSIMGADK